MYELFLLFSIVITLYCAHNQRCAILPSLIAFEFASNLSLNALLSNLDYYRFENFVPILIIRMFLTSIAALYLMKYRKNIIWGACGIIYTLVFLYQFITFNDLYFFGLDKNGVIISMYPAFMQLMSIAVMIGLLLSSSGGIKNYLGSRLYFSFRGNDNDQPSRRRMHKRPNRIFRKKTR